MDKQDSIAKLEGLLAAARQGEQIDKNLLIEAADDINRNNAPTRQVICLACGSNGTFSVFTKEINSSHALLYLTHVTLPNGEIYSGANGVLLSFVCSGCWSKLHLEALPPRTPSEVKEDEDNT